MSRLLDAPSIGSRATIHSRMLRLKNLDLIELHSVANSSKKLVVPTQLAIDGMSQMGEKIYSQEIHPSISSK